MKQNVYDCVSIINVKNKLQLHEIYSLGDTIYVRCPFCFSNKGAMALKTTNNSYICKCCEERGYSISLYAKCQHISNKQAYKELLSNEPEVKYNFNNFIVNPKKNDNELDVIYRIFLQKLSLTNEHKIKLIKLGFSTSDIEEYSFKSIPKKEEEKIKICKEIIKEGYQLQGVPRILSR